MGTGRAERVRIGASPGAIPRATARLRRGARGAARAIAPLALAVGAAAPAGAAVDTAASALDIAQAISVDASRVTAASFDALPPGGAPKALSDVPLTFFPTDGASYAILTSGDAALADDPNASGSSGASAGGGNLRGDTDFDVTILRIDLDVPAGANCLELQFQFLSEEFPEFVGSSFNDAFIAELDQSTWTTAGSQIAAPDNFAFDENGAVISINTSGATQMDAANAQGTTYDGATPLLRAATPISEGAHALFLSVFDQGDPALDSAAFIDSLRLRTVADVAVQCVPGARPLSQLDPSVALNPPGGDHTVTLTLEVAGSPIPGVDVDFAVTSGPNAGQMAVITTDAQGMASFSYTSNGAIGADEIVASYLIDGESTELSAFKFWDFDCNRDGVADTCDIDALGFGGTCSEAGGGGGSFDVDLDGVPDECLFVNDPARTEDWADGIAVSRDSISATAYVAIQDEGLEIYDVPVRDAGAPATAPALLGSFSPSQLGCSNPYFDDVAVADAIAYAAAGRCGLVALGVDVPAAPALRGVLGSPVQYAKDVAVVPNGVGAAIAYVADYFSGLWVVGVTDPGAPGNLQFAAVLVPFDVDDNGSPGSDGSPVAVDVVGGLAYVATTQGLVIVDPSTNAIRSACTTNPAGKQISDPTLTRIPQDVAVGGGRAYLPVWQDGLVVVDVSDPDALSGECVGPGLPTMQAYYHADVSESGSRLYVTEGQCGLTAWQIDGDALDELSFSPIPLPGNADCRNDGPPASPPQQSIPFAWAVDEAGGVAYVTTGTLLEPRDGNVLAVEFTVDAPLGENAPEDPEFPARPTAPPAPVGGGSCGLLGIEPFLVLLPLRWLRRARRPRRGDGF